MFLNFTPAGIEFAYRRGVFPMYHTDIDELHWYQPDPRTILPLDGFHTSGRWRKRSGRDGLRFGSTRTSRA